MKQHDKALSLSLLLHQCLKEGKKSLTLKKDVYTLFPDCAPSRPISLSNHDAYGFTSIGICLEDLDGFVLDGNGSTILADGVMVSLAILRSANITVKNLTFEARNTMRGEAVVIAHHEDGFSVRYTNTVDYIVKNDWLYYRDPYGHEDRHHYYMIIAREGEDARYLPETAECFRTEYTFEDTGDRTVRLHNPPLVPEVGTLLIMAPGLRHGCTVFLENAKSIHLENITVHSSYGMGLLAQLSEDITVDGMTIRPKGDALYSTSNDATHFVNCRGTVTVKNSFFEGMLDDALNIHGLYARIEQVDEKGLLVRDMHPGAKGQSIYRKGCHVAVMDKRILCHDQILTVEDAIPLNADMTYLTFAESLYGIVPDMTLEDLDSSPKVYFEGNTVQYNRARGILLAGRKKTVIRKNHFKTPGASILFESNGDYWYESGGTTDVLIEDNHFEHCGYCVKTWGKAVIAASPRKEFDGKRYFHGTIAIRNNRFTQNVRALVRLANVTHAIFENNEIENTVAPNAYTDCLKVSDDTL
ncbi:MAG: right-handed parallel beta-helix repeat-containing protein [Clostridia bacterium]|nr:right-handed parallel beta-helix repeat-containing protein [Clostridia bacterium]